MVAIIEADQIIDDGRRMFSVNGTALNWSPSIDVLSENPLNDPRDHNGSLQFNMTPRGNAGQIRIRLNGQDVVGPGGLPTSGRDHGVFVTFASDKTGLGNNTFTFTHDPGENATIVLEEVLVFYKRLVEGV